MKGVFLRAPPTDQLYEILSYNLEILYKMVLQQCVSIFLKVMIYIPFLILKEHRTMLVLFRTMKYSVLSCFTINVDIKFLSRKMCDHQYIQCLLLICSMHNHIVVHLLLRCEIVSSTLLFRDLSNKTDNPLFRSQQLHKQESIVKKEKALVKH